MTTRSTGLLPLLLLSVTDWLLSRLAYELLLCAHNSQ